MLKEIYMSFKNLCMYIIKMLKYIFLIINFKYIYLQ